MTVCFPFDSPDIFVGREAEASVGDAELGATRIASALAGRSKTVVRSSPTPSPFLSKEQWYDQSRSA